MDFQSLVEGNPFYILRKGEKPVLDVGVVKSKSQPRAKYQMQTPGVMNGLLAQQQQVIDIMVTVNGKDEQFAELPLNIEIASRGDNTFSGSREAMLQAVDAMLQTSKKAIEQVSYHKAVITESEKMLETLNPRYAEEKRQARTINDLKTRQDATDKKLDEILEFIRDFKK